MLKAKSPEIHSQLEKNSFITTATINSFFDYFKVPLPYFFSQPLLKNSARKTLSGFFGEAQEIKFQLYI